MVIASNIIYNHLYSTLLKRKYYYELLLLITMLLLLLITINYYEKEITMNY